MRRLSFSCAIIFIANIISGFSADVVMPSLYSDMLNFPDGGVDSMIASFLGSNVVNQTQTALASNLLGIVNAVQTTPVIYVPVPNVTAIRAEGFWSSVDKGLHSIMQTIADWLPGNKTTLDLPGYKNDIKLGTEKSGWKGFNIPVIEIGKGTYINPATMNLKTLSHLVDDLVSPFCSAAYFNASGTIPATLTYSTFTLTLKTGACAITTDFTPNPNNPYDGWLASKGFVCQTPSLSFEQDPTTFTDSHTAPATLITESCKVAVNTTDGWSKTLYTGGDPVIYPSRKALMEAMMNGTQTDIWTPSGKTDLMNAIVDPIKQLVLHAAATAPPLVIPVDPNPLKSGRRLKDIVEHA